MRNAILAIVLMAVGFLAGLAYSLSELPLADGRSDAHADRVAILMTKRLAELDALVRAQHQETLRLLRAQQRASDRSTAAVPTLPPVLEATHESRPNAVPREASPLLLDAAVQAERLAALKSWNSDTAIRARWTSASSDDVKRWFGLPHKIKQDAGANVWTYLMTERDVVVDAYEITISEGRVVSVRPSQPR